MLLPALGRARESARRSVCVSNLHQVYLATSLYAGDFDGFPPGPPAAPVWGNSLSGLDFALPAFWAIDGLHTGWWILLEDMQQKYLRRTVPHCPSVSRHPWREYGSVYPGWLGVGGFMLDYDYRWNNADVDRRVWEPQFPWYSKKVFADKKFTNIALFHETTNYRRIPADYTATYQEHLLPPPAWGFQWAHKSGGHVALHSGTVLWISNVYDTTSAPAFYSNSKSWPSGGVYTFYSYYGVGLDEYVSRQVK